MKNLLIVLLLFISTFAFGQVLRPERVKVETVLDSTQKVLLGCIIEGCKKAPMRMNLGAQSCPVYYNDEEGYTFLVKLEDGVLSIVEIDQD